MTDFLTALAAIVAALFGGAAWHRRKLSAARKDAARDLETRGAIVKVKLDAIDKTIDRKTEDKIRKVRADTAITGDTTAAANNLHATRNEW